MKGGNRARLNCETTRARAHHTPQASQIHLFKNLYNTLSKFYCREESD